MLAESELAQAMTPITNLLGIVITSYVGYMIAKLAKVGNAIHTLVNSNMQAQLKISWIALKRLADETRNPTDIQAAEMAEKLYLEHEAKQTIVDNTK